MPGRWLGVATNVGAMMCYHILQANGHVVARSTVSNPTNLELQTDEVKATFAEFDASIDAMLRDDEFPDQGDKPDPENWADIGGTDEDFREEFFKAYEDPNLKDAFPTAKPRYHG